MRWGKWFAALGCIVFFGLRMGHAATTPSDERLTNAAASEQKVLIFGDSLSAEYGLPRGSGWVHRIEERLGKRKTAYQIRNASISGDTTINGLNRLPAVLDESNPDIVILQLGANDGLRGLPISQMRDNLRAMIEMSQEAGAKVLLVGQQVPPNYGQRYSREFHDVYAEVAKETDVALVPFMLEGIALDAGMFQADGLHPTVEAQARIADVIWPHLVPLLSD